MGGLSTALCFERAPFPSAQPWWSTDDGTELFYEIRDMLLKSVFAKMRRRANWQMKSYLGQEDFFNDMSERMRAGGANEMAFSFFDEGYGISPSLALHAFEIAMALDIKPLDRRIKAAGGAIDRSQHDLAKRLGLGLRQPFFVSLPGRPSARVRAVDPWRREQSVEELPTITPALPLETLPQAELQELRAMAMTGWCRCDMCATARTRRKIPDPPLDETVTRAWEAMQRDPEGSQLADCAASALAARGSDTAGSEVLGDWLHARGIEVARTLLPGLALKFGRSW